MTGLATLMLVSMAGCLELEVQNPNAPDASRALATPGDVEALIAGAFNRWLNFQGYSGATMALSNVAAEHVAPWGNAGMESWARIPRVPTDNIAGGQDVGNLTYGWTQAYRAIAALRDGLKQIQDDVVDLDKVVGSSNLRAQAYGKFIQGVAHGSIALLYDSGFVYDETIDPTTVVLQDYNAVMTAALGYLQDAADLAGTGSFTIPDTWLSNAVTQSELAKMAYSLKAMFRAGVARTPTERADVDWAAVKSDANKGVTTDWTIHSTWTGATDFYDEGVDYRNYPGWNMTNNWVLGMADQSGAYQTWINTATPDKQPFVIVTPDTRFPQGADEAEQLAMQELRADGFSWNAAGYYSVSTGADGSRIWFRPDRGTWRWSYYYNTREPFMTHSNDGDAQLPWIKVQYLQALIAEANFRGEGTMTDVANFVNATRTANGLAATDANGANADCVPKLPNGSCGNLWEMLKWESRMESMFQGTLRIHFWIDGRGWGDLMEGSRLQLPVPYTEMQLLGQKPYNFGGVGGVSAAPVGTYGY